MRAPKRVVHIGHDASASGRQGRWRFRCESCNCTVPDQYTKRCVRCVNSLRQANNLKLLPVVDDQMMARRGAVYGITPAQMVRMAEDQHGGCAICQTVPPVFTDLHIDHNHTTGEVRGLLCPTCNTALGMFRDSPEVLMRALEYLEDRGHYGQAIQD